MWQIRWDWCVIIFLIMMNGLPLNVVAGEETSSSRDRATMLVIQAYEMGHSSAVFARQQELLKEALALSPDHPEAHNNLASIFEEENEHDSALDHYAKAAAANPLFAAPWFGMGEVYLKTGRPAFALECYLKAGCRGDRQAREKAARLVENKNGWAAEPGQITDKNSILLMLDPERRAEITRMLSQCGIRAQMRPVLVFRNILFETGSSAIKAESMNQVREIALALQEGHVASLTISGHTDRQPFANKSQVESDEANVELSRMRAESVAGELRRLGAGGTVLRTLGVGPFQPEVPDESPEAYARNRRVVIEAGTID